MRRDLSDGDFAGEFWEQLAGYEQTAWRWECQPVYAITAEQDLIDAWRSDRPADPLADEYMGPWMRQVAEQTASGRQIGRVRVMEEPPTEYQRWELWLDRWNTAAGERIDYLTRSQARRLEAAHPSPFGSADWWFFDARRVMIMHFDAAGFRTRVELTDEPTDVFAAINFRHHAVTAARLAQETSHPAAA
jgi:hypothetical protein